MEFWRYYRVLRRRRWFMIVAVLAAVAAVLVTDRPGGADFEATATLSVPPEQRFFAVSQGPALAATQDRTALAMNLIQRREVAERVIQGLNLDMRPGELESRLRVQKELGSELIRVTVSGKTPGEAVTLANAVADEAVAFDQEVTRRQATLSREFVEKQVEEAQASLRGAEDALLTFQQANEVVLASSQGAQIVNLETESQRDDLSLREIDAKLSAVRTQISQQSATRSDPEITDNPIAQQLREQLVGLEVSLTSELAVHTESHPNVIALRARIQAVKDRLNTELTKVVSLERVQHNPIYDALVQNRINLETERLALLAEKEALKRAISESERDLPGYAQKRLEQTRLTRTVEILGKAFSDLQDRLAAARLREQEVQNLQSLTIVEHAGTAQPSPLRAKRFKLTFASVLGLLGGAGLAFFLEYLDTTLKTPEIAERVLGVPALAAIPRHNPPFEEAYRLLRANLAAREGSEGATVIVATSPKPGAGTSTVVANLAHAFAQAGQRTIVVDAALRRPTQHAQFGVVNEKGLADILAGTATPQEALVATHVPNLWLLPSGAAPKGTGESLSPKAMAGVLTDLKRLGDVILVDTPPAGAFADAFAVAPLASRVLLVLDAGQAPRRVEEQVKAQLGRLGASVLGIVLTKVRPDLVDSYFYQKRFYRRARRRMPLPVAAAALVVIAAAGILGGIYVRAGQIEGLPFEVQRTVVHWVTSLSLPWMSGQ